MLRKIGATGFGQFDAPIVNNASSKHFFCIVLSSLNLIYSKNSDFDF